MEMCSKVKMSGVTENTAVQNSSLLSYYLIAPLPQSFVLAVLVIIVVIAQIIMFLYSLSKYSKYFVPSNKSGIPISIVTFEILLLKLTRNSKSCYRFYAI